MVEWREKISSGFNHISWSRTISKKRVKWYQLTSEISEIKAVRCNKCKIGFFIYGDTDKRKEDDKK
jgi:hypothetical protein